MRPGCQGRLPNGETFQKEGRRQRDKKKQKIEMRCQLSLKIEMGHGETPSEGGAPSPTNRR